MRRGDDIGERERHKHVGVYLKNDVISLSLLSPLYQGNTLSLTNVVTYPHCFLTAYKSLLRLPVLTGTWD